MKLLRAAGILLMAATLGLTGCIKPVKEPIERTGIHFDTVINLKIYDTDDISLLDDCFKFCEEFEQTVSRTLETSEIYQINHSNGNPVEVSDITIELLQKGIEYAILTVKDKDANLMAQRLVNYGIKGIVNMTNVILAVPKNIKVINLSVVNSLMELSVGTQPVK